MSQQSVIEVLIDYAMSTGARNIGDRLKLWESRIDEHWTIQCNGHTETIDDHPPGCFTIYYNGWPAGIIALDGGGVIAAGENANEEILIAAIKSKMSKEKAGSE